MHLTKLRAVIWALLVAGMLEAAAPVANPRLEQARRQADDFDYAGALRSLELALVQVGNERETMLAIFELEGVVWGNLNKGPKARAAFVTLLLLDPDRKLSGDHPPRVRTPFYEAKEIVNRLGALTLARAPLSKESDQIASVGVTVKRDPQKQTRALRFHLQVGERERVTLVVPDSRGRASVPIVATEVRWWVELLGEREAVLITLGTHDAPLVDSALAPPEPPPAPLVQAPPKATELAPPAASARAWMRPTGIGLGAAGLVAGAAGAYFGVTSLSARALFTNATRDGTGAITSLTQVEAQEANRRAIDSATIANTLFATAAGLLGLGVTFIVAGGPEEVVVAPAGAGVTVSGRF